MNSDEMWYNYNRHPEHYYMDVFGVIRMREQNGDENMEETAVIIRATEGECDATQDDKMAMLERMGAYFPDTNFVIDETEAVLRMVDIKEASNTLYKQVIGE